MSFNPFPIVLFYTNKATGGGGLFVTTYVFFERPPLKVIFWGPRVYLGIGIGLMIKYIYVNIKILSDRSDKKFNLTVQLAQAKDIKSITQF